MMLTKRKCLLVNRFVNRLVTTLRQSKPAIGLLVDER